MTSTDSGSDTVDAAANFWRIDDWEDGTTEQGSSGSCLWDAASGLCVGMLSGGFASCTAATERDWYGKFSSSWTGGGTNSTRLSNWLDPGNTGVVSLNGDPHLVTLDGVRYDFQGAGEYVALTDPSGAEVQVRQSPISTTFVPGPDSYHGLATCVSLNSAVAARVGGRRVTYQPRLDGEPDRRSLELRVDGELVEMGDKPFELGDGAVIIPVGNDGSIVVELPEKYALTVTPGFWTSQNAWYLNVSIARRPVITNAGASPGNGIGIGGLTADLAHGSWLPALADGTSLGSMPASLDDRYTALYDKFGQSWRVSDAKSLFDYAPGQSTASFTDEAWPRPDDNKSCPVAGSTPVAEPLDFDRALKICGELGDDKELQNCVFDVMVTGDEGFAQTYLRSVELVKQVAAPGFQ